MTPPFTEAGYRATIQGLLSRGYGLRSFHELDPTRQHLVLRHDIDQSIPAARRMADIEAGEGWSSTWFVLLRTEMYNPFSRAATQDIRAMVAAGHEVGLHLDASLYGDAASLEAGAAGECRALEDIAGAPVRIVSFHRPAAALLGGAGVVAGRPHTYGDRFTKETGYCSDSRGAWRHGHPFDHPAVASGTALQLLTHAVWWIGPAGRTRVERLADVLDAARSRLDDELAANNEVWRDHRAGSAG